MGREFRDALGGAILALTLVVPLLLGGGAEPSSTDPLLRPQDDIVAVSLGWPVSPTCADVRVWEGLPGIGPVRAARLADAASRGQLRGPVDLLQVPGIGIKMATLLVPRVEWSLPVPVQLELR